ncbi:Mss4-like protein [Mucor mucedo]|uniref:Mss4-like protein n=1 Tax=Mucor mucedo TaxID=29922 RepID=UPI00221F589F|nr:Mss4-like protein [Mucor mucedo]KAI7866923.1 Mss4-like protein [Mucor mucedo]
MELKGSCHCEKVSFKVLSHTPAPFMQCYCSICRKCQGGGGYAINIMGQYKTLEILTGKEYLKGYQAMKDKKKKELGGNIRYFCSECGSHLYAYDKQWAEWVYPFASAIDTPLPQLDPKTQVYKIMLDSKANWVDVPDPNKEAHAFEAYPDCSLEQWHKDNGQYIE